MFRLAEVALDASCAQWLQPSKREAWQCDFDFPALQSFAKPPDLRLKAYKMNAIGERKNDIVRIGLELMHEYSALKSASSP